jgi:23S rRNA pseudouridine1911/1915/1917 synthase
LKPGQTVRAVLPEIPREAPTPEAIPLDVLYEDDWLAVVNKPPGMVVHPARGNWTGTLAAALQHRFAGDLSSVGGPARPGIVHRLDRDTSGAILVAKHDLAHSKLAVLFQDRQIEKEYYAIVLGVPQRDRDVIDRPIGMHPTQREKMAIRRNDPESKPAETFYEVDERFDGFATLRVLPKTGRTHQIRVHLCHVGHPILCDRQYGGHSRITLGEIDGSKGDSEALLERQALHARRLKFAHPESGESMEIIAPLPGDIAGVLEGLRRHRAV